MTCCFIIDYAAFMLLYTLLMPLPMPLSLLMDADDYYAFRFRRCHYHDDAVAAMPFARARFAAAAAITLMLAPADAAAIIALSSPLFAMPLSDFFFAIAMRAHYAREVLFCCFSPDDTAAADDAAMMRHFLLFLHAPPLFADEALFFLMLSPFRVYFVFIDAAALFSPPFSLSLLPPLMPIIF